jgi:fructokinase
LQTLYYLCSVFELPGQQDKNDERSMTNLFEAIKKIAKENPEGFTVKIPDLEWVISGYVVAYCETQNCFGDEGLKKVIRHAEKHAKIAGGWLNEENKHSTLTAVMFFKPKMKQSNLEGSKNKLPFMT